MKENKEKKVVRLTLEPETMKWYNKHSVTNSKVTGNQNLASKAIEFYHEYSVYRKGFFIRLIDNHFSEIKALLRKIGRSKKRVADSEGRYWDGT